MQQHDASVCLLTSRANVTYFTGFVPRNNEHLHCASLVTHDDVITLTAADVTELSVWAASGMHVDGRAASAYMRDYFASVGSVLASFRERIAVDCDVRAQRFLARVRQEAAEGEKKPSGSDRVRNVAAQIMRMRRTKSGHEVDVLRNAVHSAHVGAEAALVAIKEGVGEFKVTMHASRAMVRSIAQFYRRCDVSDSESKTSQLTCLDTSFYFNIFVQFSAWVWLQNSLKEDSRSGILSHRKIQKEDSLLLRCCPIVEGLVLVGEFVAEMLQVLISCRCMGLLGRSVFVGQPTDEQVRVWEENLRIHERACDLIKPGVKCSDVAVAVRELYR